MKFRAVWLDGVCFRWVWPVARDEAATAQAKPGNHCGGEAAVIVRRTSWNHMAEQAFRSDRQRNYTSNPSKPTRWHPGNIRVKSR